MTTVTVRPTSTTRTSGSTLVGAAATLHAALADELDTTYATNSSGGTSKVVFAGATLPTGSLVDSVILRLRNRAAGGADGPTYYPFILGLATGASLPASEDVVKYDNDAHAGALRGGVSWPSIDTAQDGTLPTTGLPFTRLQALDDYIDDCNTRGIKVLLQIADGQSSQDMDDPVKWQPYADFIIAMFDRYQTGNGLGTGGRDLVVESIECGNEPNLNGWAETPNPEQYARMMKRISDGVTLIGDTTVRPKIMLGGMAGTPQRQVWNNGLLVQADGSSRAGVPMSCLEWTFGLYAKHNGAPSVKGHYDVINTHRYTWPQTPTEQLLDPGHNPRGWVSATVGSSTVDAVDGTGTTFLALPLGVQAIVDRMEGAPNTKLHACTEFGVPAPVPALNNRGVWANSTAYAVYDKVTHGGDPYFCIEPHTSTAGSGGDEPGVTGSSWKNVWKDAAAPGAVSAARWVEIMDSAMVEYAKEPTACYLIYFKDYDVPANNEGKGWGIWEDNFTTQKPVIFPKYVNYADNGPPIPAAATPSIPTTTVAKLNGGTDIIFTPASSFGTQASDAQGGFTAANIAAGITLTFGSVGDDDDLAAAYLDINYIERPEVNVTAPAGTISVSSPTVRWDTTSTNPQAKYQVKIFTEAQYTTGGFDPTSSAAFYDSGELNGDVESLVPTATLDNGVTYRFYVRVAQLVGSTTQYSAWDFTTGTVATVGGGEGGSLTVTPEDNLARIRIALGDIAIPPAASGFGVGPFGSGPFGGTVAGFGPSADLGAFVTIQRTSDGGTTWTTVRSADRAPVFGDSFVIYDYETCNGQDVQYRAQSINAAGAASDWTELSAPKHWSSTKTWLKSPTLPAINRAVFLNDIAPRTRRQPQGVFDISGRADPVVVNDTRKLTEGTVTFGVLDPDDAAAPLFATLKQLLKLLDRSEVLLLQVPPPDGFGCRYIAVGDAVESPVAPRGDRCERLLECPYIEVLAPAGEIVGIGVTWQDVLDRYTNWNATLLANTSWAELLELT